MKAILAKKLMLQQVYIAVNTAKEVILWAL